MAFVFLPKKSYLPQSVRTVLFPLVTLVVLIFLWFTILKFGLSQRTIQGSKLSELKKNVEVLSSKETLLKKVENSVTSEANSVTFALPPRNPILALIAQMRNLAIENNLIMDNLRASSRFDEEGGVSVSQVSFTVDGAMENIFAFIASTKTISPIVSVQKLGLVEDQGVAKATISLSTYWAKFPERITAIDETVSEFSEDDQDLISDIKNLRKPGFSEVFPQEPQSRENPFEL